MTCCSVSQYVPCLCTIPSKGDGIVFKMALCSLFGFVIAQTPHRIRGIIVGLVLTSFSVGGLDGVLLTKLFHQV